MDQVRVGVIGVGNMGQRHCRVYSVLPRARLVGICDAASEVGHRVAQQYNVPLYSRVDELLEQVDAVTLAVPTPLHFDLAMRCLAHGVHVLVEKPVTNSLETAEVLARAARGSGLIVQVGHIERFNPAYLELKSVLKDVTVLALSLRRLSPHESSNRDVDVILDLMIHDIDIALDLVEQEPNGVDAYGLTAFDGAVDYAVAHLSFDTSPLVTLTASRITEQKVRSIEVTALEAYLEGDLLHKTILLHRHTVGQYLNHSQRGVKYRQESIIEKIHVPMVEPLFLELEHFVNCILSAQPPRVSVEDAIKSLRLAVLIEERIRKSLVDLTSLRPAHDDLIEPALAGVRG